MDYLARQKGIRIEDLKVEEGDRSRRLDQDMLEKVWLLSSQHDLRDIPFWAKADPVVRQIMDPRSPSPTGELSNPANHTGSSKFPPSSDLNMAESATTNTPACDDPISSDERRDRLTHSSIKTPPSCLSPVHTEPQQRSSNNHCPMSKTKQSSQRKRPSQSMAKKGGVTRRLRKGVQKPALSTRSRNIIHFYELGPSGVAIRRLKY